MTRSLKTPIIGLSAAPVDSSRIDMLARLSKCESRRIPPCLWANAGSAANIARTNEPAAANPLRFCFISSTSLGFRGFAAPTWRLRTPAKPAVASCYPGSLPSSRSRCRRFVIYHRSNERGRTGRQNGEGRGRHASQHRDGAEGSIRRGRGIGRGVRTRSGELATYAMPRTSPLPAS